MTKKESAQEKRKKDPYLDRRSGEDQRETYNIDYFSEGGIERRDTKDRRKPGERRKDCIKVSRWSSVCPEKKSTASEE